MELVITGSESLGNGYILQSEDEVLLIESGIRLSYVKKALNYDLSGVVGCLVSHAHGDHFKYANNYAKAGISIYTSKETIAASKITHKHRFFAIGDMFLRKLGRFSVMPFKVPHGDTHCLGFLIHHPETGSFVFITDASHVVNRFNNLSQILIEANYSDETLTSDRAVGKHMSLETTLNFLKANDLSKVQNIVLLHLSASNSNAKDFTKAVQDIAPGAKVWVGDKGLSIKLSKHPF